MLTGRYAYILTLRDGRPDGRKVVRFEHVGGIRGAGYADGV